jgi:hypothetical protein
LEIDLDSWIVRAPQPLAAEIDDGLVLLSLEAETYFGFNPTAAAIWRLIEAPASVRGVRDALLEGFDAAPDRVTATLLAFLSRLLAHRLIEIRPGDGRATGV